MSDIKYKTELMADFLYPLIKELEDEAFKTAFYKHKNEFNDIIYVGISSNIINRQSVHLKERKENDWQYEICSIDVEWFPNRIIAEMEEIAFIKKYEPKYNKQYKREILKSPCGKHSIYAFGSGEDAVISEIQTAQRKKMDKYINKFEKKFKKEKESQDDFWKMFNDHHDKNYFKIHNEDPEVNFEAWQKELENECDRLFEPYSELMGIKELLLNDYSDEKHIINSTNPMLCELIYRIGVKDGEVK